MITQKKWLINLYGAPSAGKSVAAATMYHALAVFTKEKIELVPEVAKMMYYQGKLNGKTPNRLITIQQYESIMGALRENDIVITDSPIYLGVLYGTAKQLCERLDNQIGQVAKQLNYYLPIQNIPEYNSAGRVQTFNEAIDIDAKMREVIPVGWNHLDRNKVVAEISRIMEIARCTPVGN